MEVMALLIFKHLRGYFRGKPYDSGEKGERDRPGRSSRRLADWERAVRRSLNADNFHSSHVFGEAPNTATVTVALPFFTEFVPAKAKNDGHPSVCLKESS